MSETPRENEAAAAQFTKVYNSTRDHPEGVQAALGEVQQQEVRVDLDASVFPQELAAVLGKARKNKATSNGVAIELLDRVRHIQRYSAC